MGATPEAVRPMEGDRALVLLRDELGVMACSAAPSLSLV
jgi:hypothetical protein